MGSESSVYHGEKSNRAEQFMGGQEVERRHTHYSSIRETVLPKDNYQDTRASGGILNPGFKHSLKVPQELDETVDGPFCALPHACCAALDDMVDNCFL